MLYDIIFNPNTKGLSSINFSPVTELFNDGYFTSDDFISFNSKPIISTIDENEDSFYAYTSNTNKIVIYKVSNQCEVKVAKEFSFDLTDSLFNIGEASSLKISKLLVYQNSIYVVGITGNLTTGSYNTTYGVVVFELSKETLDVINNSVHFHALTDTEFLYEFNIADASINQFSDSQYIDILINYKDNLTGKNKVTLIDFNLTNKVFTHGFILNYPNNIKGFSVIGLNHYIDSVDENRDVVTIVAATGEENQVKILTVFTIDKATKEIVSTNAFGNLGSYSDGENINEALYASIAKNEDSETYGILATLNTFAGTKAFFIKLEFSDLSLDSSKVVGDGYGVGIVYNSNSNTYTGGIYSNFGNELGVQTLNITFADLENSAITTEPRSVLLPYQTNDLYFYEKPFFHNVGEHYYFGFTSNAKVQSFFIKNIVDNVFNGYFNTIDYKLIPSEIKFDWINTLTESDFNSSDFEALNQIANQNLVKTTSNSLNVSKVIYKTPFTKNASVTPNLLNDSSFLFTEEKAVSGGSVKIIACERDKLGNIVYLICTNGNEFFIESFDTNFNLKWSRKLSISIPNEITTPFYLEQENTAKIISYKFSTTLYVVSSISFANKINPLDGSLIGGTGILIMPFNPISGDFGQANIFYLKEDHQFLSIDDIEFYLPYGDRASPNDSIIISGQRINNATGGHKRGFEFNYSIQNRTLISSKDFAYPDNSDSCLVSTKIRNESIYKLFDILDQQSGGRIFYIDIEDSYNGNRSIKFKIDNDSFYNYYFIPTNTFIYSGNINACAKNLYIKNDGTIVILFNITINGTRTVPGYLVFNNSLSLQKFVVLNGNHQGSYITDIEEISDGKIILFCNQLELQPVDNNSQILTDGAYSAVITILDFNNVNLSSSVKLNDQNLSVGSAYSGGMYSGRMGNGISFDYDAITNTVLSAIHYTYNLNHPEYSVIRSAILQHKLTDDFKIVPPNSINEEINTELTKLNFTINNFSRDVLFDVNNQINHGFNPFVILSGSNTDMIQTDNLTNIANTIVMPNLTIYAKEGEFDHTVINVGNITNNPVINVEYENWLAYGQYNLEYIPFVNYVFDHLNNIITCSIISDTPGKLLVEKRTNNLDFIWSKVYNLDSNLITILGGYTKEALICFSKDQNNIVIATLCTANNNSELNTEINGSIAILTIDIETGNLTNNQCKLFNTSDLEHNGLGVTYRLHSLKDAYIDGSAVCITGSITNPISNNNEFSELEIIFNIQTQTFTNTHIRRLNGNMLTKLMSEKVNETERLTLTTNKIITTGESLIEIEVRSEITNYVYRLSTYSLVNGIQFDSFSTRLSRQNEISKANYNHQNGSPVLGVEFICNLIDIREPSYPSYCSGFAYEVQPGDANLFKFAMGEGTSLKINDYKKLGSTYYFLFGLETTTSLGSLILAKIDSSMFTDYNYGTNTISLNCYKITNQDGQDIGNVIFPYNLDTESNGTNTDLIISALVSPQRRNICFKFDLDENGNIANTINNVPGDLIYSDYSSEIRIEPAIINVSNIHLNNIVSVDNKETLLVNLNDVSVNTTVVSNTVNNDMAFTIKALSD